MCGKEDTQRVVRERLSHGEGQHAAEVRLGISFVVKRSPGYGVSG